MENGNNNLAGYLSFYYNSFSTLGKNLMQIEFVPLRTLAMTIIIVPIMVFVLMPFITTLLGIG